MLSLIDVAPANIRIKFGYFNMYKFYLDKFMVFFCIKFCKIINKMFN